MHFKNFCFSLFFLGLFQLISAQGSIKIDSIYSTKLQKYSTYSIYLPEGYHQNITAKYPVIYLLHGMGGGPFDYEKNASLSEQVNTAIKDSILPKTLIVMPDGEATYYMNNIHKEYEYEDFFFEELIPHIESTFKCKTGKENRGVAGLSMGGFGALLYAFHHPELFVAASAMSPAVRTDEEILALTDKAFERRYKTALGSPKTKAERISTFYNSNSILYLAKHLPESKKNLVQLYIDCGDDDFLYKGNSTLHITFRNNHIPHEYRVREGGHTWEYWTSGLITALQFITKNF